MDPEVIPASLQQPVVLIERPCFSVKITSGSPWAEFRVVPDAVLDHHISWEAKQVLEQTSPGTRFYLLVDSEGFFRVTRKARKLAASREFSTHLAAVACYTPHSSLSLLGELYNKINKPAVPTRVFSSREQAVEWLTEQMHQAL